MLSQSRTTSLLEMCVVVFCAVLLGTANGAHAQALGCDGGLDPISPPQTIETSSIPENCFGGGPPGPNDCTDDGCMIDLLVVYTADARDGAGGTAFIEILIAEAVNSINGAFTNSQIDSYVRLAGTALVVYQETGDKSDDLDHLQDRDGFMDEALDLRDDLHADTVMLIVESYVGGLAYLSVMNGTSHSGDAFGVVGRSLAAELEKWYFAHEFGHILGCRHHVVDEPLNGAFPYCHAYTNCVGASFATLVASNGCAPRVLFYSNPEIEYEGFPMGVPINQPCPDPPLVSECPAHNSKCINLTAPLIAGFRTGDCNLNGVCDAEDVAAGTSLDCNGNQVPDECEPDCNGNQILDSCDISTGTSPDCNANGIPDECDGVQAGNGDCNGNSVFDLCDINCAATGSPAAFFECDQANGLCGLSDDCNGNCIPDECEIVGSCSGVDPCCSSHSLPGCECPRCCAAVCQIEPLCCTLGWISQCATYAATIPVCACGLSGVCLDFDCNDNQILDECDITSGTSSDCNANEMPDECEIAVGISNDCNANNVPDDCEPDCDGDGIPDDCDSGCQAGDLCCNFVCRECCVSDDCGSGELCCNYKCETWECCDGSDCTDPFKPLCRPWDNVCVLCYDDSHCGSNCCCMANGSCSCGPFACNQYLWGP